MKDEKKASAKEQEIRRICSLLLFTFSLFAFELHSSFILYLSSFFLIFHPFHFMRHL